MASGVVRYLLWSIATASLLAAVVSSGCNPTNSMPPINGKVVRAAQDMDGSMLFKGAMSTDLEPIQNATVRVFLDAKFTREVENVSTTSDGNGGFQINTNMLPPATNGYYYLSVDMKNFQSLQAPIRIGAFSPYNFVRVCLAPVRPLPMR